MDGRVGDVPPLDRVVAEAAHVEVLVVGALAEVGEKREGVGHLLELVRTGAAALEEPANSTTHTGLLINYSYWPDGSRNRIRIRPTSYMLLSEGYVQRAKIAYHVDDEPVIEWEGKALDAAIHAAMLDSENYEAHSLVKDRRARLNRLTSK